MRKISFLLFLLIIWCNKFFAQTITSIRCAPDTTIYNTPLLCTGTARLSEPIINYMGTPVILGNALAFDGANDYVLLGTNALLKMTNAMTIEAWVKVNSFTKNWQAIVTKGDNSWRLHRYLATNEVSFGTTGLSNTDLKGSKNINDGQWHHIAGVYTGSMKLLYIDGILDASVAATGTISASNYAACIGENLQMAGRQFDGSIDEVRIWNIARTQQELQVAINAELNTQPGLLAAYHFNQGTAGGNNTGLTSVNDASGNSITGTLLNFALNGTTSNWVAGQNPATKITNNAPATYPPGNTIVTWTATDGSGNTFNCNQTVTVVSPSGTQVVAQNNVVIADGDATPSVADLTDFQDVGNAGFSTSRIFTIKNPSAVPLSISDIILTGEFASEFRINNIGLPSTIAANGEISFSLSFAPSSGVGIKTATVNITTSSCSIGSYDFGIQGNSISTQSIVYNNSGNYTPLPGVTSVVVQAWGTGANGGSLDGGGGGGYVKSLPIPISGQAISIAIPDRSQGSNAIETSFGSFIKAYGTITSAGGPISTGTQVAISYMGGNGGKGNTQFSFWGGGGGGAAGVSGSGGDGQTNNRSDYYGAGGVAGSNGGNGGKGGTLANVYPAQNAGNGFTPGGGGGGGNVSGKGANGRVIVLYTCDTTHGVIGNAHSVPYPPQITFDSILNVSGTVSTAENRLIYRWEQSTDNTNWVAAKTYTSTLSYRFDKDSLKVTTYYRRVSNACGTNNYSNVVKIEVINPVNGIIEGKVTSKNGTPVNGITVFAQKISGLPGSPVSWKDSAVTGFDGKYKITKIYYGDPNEGNNAGNIETGFVITPVKLNHGFNPGSLTKNLSNISPQISNIDFTDTTLLSITGKIYQECKDCLNATDNVATITAPVDSVEIYKDDLYHTKSGFIDPPGEFGRYAVTVSNPGKYKIQPKYKTHQFSPAFADTLVEGNLEGINFKDTTTCTISGNFTAGCGNYIGQATLEFYDVLPNDANNNPRVSQFRKRVTTNAGSGFYSITLPARKYAVKLVENSFVPVSGTDVTAPDLFSFINTKIPADSLIRDISAGNATLNITYNRPPTLQLVGLDAACTGTPNPFVLFQQGIQKTFYVKAWQGAALYGCPVTDSTLTIITNLQKDDVNETLIGKKNNLGVFEVKLKGGKPNVIAPYTKVLSIELKDSYGRSVTANPVVALTGIKTNVGSFTTVTPEIPIMVLHDPPGDNSYSSWKTGVTNETVTRFYYSSSGSQNNWEEGKLGAALQFITGAIVEVGFEVSVWGKLSNGITAGCRYDSTATSVITTTTTETFSTSNNTSVIGAKGDVFIGGAINLLYSTAIEISYNPDNCSLTSKPTVAVAPNGFATQFIYSEDHIRTNVIPVLSKLRDSAQTGGEKGKEYYNNQIKAWQQILDNNQYNKNTATFDRNWSFDGAVGPYVNTTTSSSSKSNTIEFSTYIDKTVATEVGFEIAGSGYQNVVETKWKMETGKSSTNTTLNSSTFEYQLDDADNGDFYSVDVKKDPVYNSPVFELKAGVSSCPFEPGTQPRDEIQLIADQPSISGIAADGVAEFKLRLGNTSQSQETRTYNFSFVPGSNPDGAKVEIFGSPATATPSPYTIGYLAEKVITVRVSHPASSNVFSYEGLQFIATDSCSGTISKTASISAFFEAGCGSISLLSPGKDWIVNSAANNILPVVFNGYNKAGTSSVTLEYLSIGNDTWKTGFTLLAAELSSSANGTSINWNIAALAIPDGNYQLRLKLVCSAGVVYSERIAGIIDRASPLVFGNPQPTDDNLIAGDQISISFNEALNVNSIDSNNVRLYRLSNKQRLSVNLVGYANQLIIVPNSSLLNFTNDSFLVVIQNIPDLYGNLKTTADSISFVVGKSIADTSGKAINLSVSKNSIANNAGARALAGPVPKNPITGNTLGAGDNAIAVYFDLKSNAVNETRINFNIGGSAVYGRDYTLRFDSVGQSFVNKFDGTSGSLLIAQGTKRGIVRIDPIYNPDQNTSKTIVISALEGGDYGLGNVISATVYILNASATGIFEFTGSGNFSNTNNWRNGLKPGTSLPAGSEILINPITGGECILDVSLIIMPGGKLTVGAGKKLRIIGNLNIK